MNLKLMDGRPTLIIKSVSLTKTAEHKTLHASQQSMHIFFRKKLLHSLPSHASCPKCSLTLHKLFTWQFILRFSITTQYDAPATFQKCIGICKFVKISENKCFMNKAAEKVWNVVVSSPNTEIYLRICSGSAGSNSGRAKTDRKQEFLVFSISQTPKVNILKTSSIEFIVCKQSLFLLKSKTKNILREKYFFHRIVLLLLFPFFINVQSQASAIEERTLNIV